MPHSKMPATEMNSLDRKNNNHMVPKVERQIAIQNNLNFIATKPLTDNQDR
jgi:hypothetical protein